MVMGQLTTKVDVVVIGGGPGGYTAAIRAAQLGLETALVEKGKLGGICTNAGCIPSKALLHAAETLYSATGKNAAGMGIYADVRLDFAKTQAWKDGVVSGLRDGIASLCRMNGVEVIEGTASFSGPGTGDRGDRGRTAGNPVQESGHRYRNEAEGASKPPRGPCAHY